MEQKKLSQLVSGDTFIGFVIIRNLTVRTGSNGKNFIDMSVADASSDLNGKMWSYTEEQIKDIKPNSFVKIKATVSSWNNAPQLRVENIRLATSEDPARIEDFVPSAPDSPEKMLAKIFEYMGRISRGDLKAIVEYSINKFMDKILYFPAAMSNHHAVRGGLLYHTTTMLASAEALANVYTDLDKDWLFAGVIMHDVEKMEEMNSNELGMVSDYTKRGVLLGHLVMGPLLVAEAGKAVNASDETVVLLQHMLLSHHYEPEFGSPKKPMFPEAELLHYLDMIDARMYDFRKALNETQEGAFSPKQFSLDDRRIYKMIKNEE